MARLSEDERIDLAIRLKHGLAPESERRGRGKATRPDGPLDALDLRILRALNKDARQSLRAIARDLNLALSTVSNRVKALEEAGIIKGYVPVLDSHKLGFDITVVIGVKIAKGHLVEVQERLARNPRVYGVYDTTGEWDSMVLARFRDREDLNGFVKDALNTAHVERSNTMLVLNTMKEERRVLL